MASPAWQQLPVQSHGAPDQAHWQQQPPPGTTGNQGVQGQMQRGIFPCYPPPALPPFRGSNSSPGTQNSSPMPMPSSPNLPVYQSNSPSAQPPLSGPNSPNVLGQPPPPALHYGHLRWPARPDASILGARPNSPGLIQPPPQWILPGQPQIPFLYPPGFPFQFPRQDGIHSMPPHSFRAFGDPFAGGAAAFGVWVDPAAAAASTAAHKELPDFHSHKVVNAEDKVSDSKSEKLLKFEVSEEDSWAAHKTEDGIIYYYNSVTGASTYEKPANFKGEANATSQPTPIACDKLPGTDWLLVTTNDGKKYYYNPKTQATSWQVPAEIVDKAKKDDGTPINAPAVLSGGREAKGTVSNALTALDTVKKKLQEFSSTASASTSDPDGVKDEAKDVTDDTEKDKMKENPEASSSESSSDSEEEGPSVTKEERIQQFKDMLKETGVAPFSKWDKELPKFIFDPRFKAIASHSERRSIFEHYVRTRAEEERKEKRAAQKAAVEGFKQLLDEAVSMITCSTTYESFASVWSQDSRFEALDRKDKEILLNERVSPLKKAEDDRAKSIYEAVASEFQAMLKERNDITVNSRWSKVKDLVRQDPRCKAVKHEDRENIFNAYVAGLRAAEQEGQRVAKAKRDEENKLRERERELRKRKERDEQDLERVKAKARRKDAVTAYQALLTEKIKDAEASWTESRSKLEKDPLGRANNPELDMADRERLFRDHLKELYERCERDFKALLADVFTPEAISKHVEDGKDVLGSWSDAKDVLKSEHRYNRTPRRSREILWHRYAQEIQRKIKPPNVDKDKDAARSRRHIG